MFQTIKILYNYLKLFTILSYTKYYNIDIKNDISYIKSLKNSIDGCGFMMIKCVQWLLPAYDLLYPDTLLYDNFKIFFDKCMIHDIRYTQKMFWNMYNTSIYDHFENLNVIGSGSTGQVYVCEHIQSHQKYAIKVLHPNVIHEYKIFKTFMHILSKFVNYKDYLPINDIDIFFKCLENQIDLNYEYRYNQKFYELYKDVENIIIPKIYKSSKEILIMEYLEGETFDSKSLGHYDSYKNLMKLIIFTNNNCLHGLCHGDIHNGNWSIKKDKLVVYDYAYCFDIDYDEYTLINDLISKDDKTDIHKDFFNYYLDKPYNSHLNKDDILKDIHIPLEIYNNSDKNLHNYISILFNFCLEKNMYITTTCLNGLLIFLQLIKIFDDVKILQNQSTYESYFLDILNHCKSENICPKLIEYCNEKIENNGNKCMMSDKFENFECLKKYM